MELCQKEFPSLLDLDSSSTVCTHFFLMSYNGLFYKLSVVFQLFSAGIVSCWVNFIILEAESCKKILRYRIYNKKKSRLYKQKYSIKIQKRVNSNKNSKNFLSHSLWPHGLHHARLPCPLPLLRACSDSCPLSQGCHPITLSSVIPFS